MGDMMKQKEIFDEDRALHINPLSFLVIFFTIFFYKIGSLGTRRQSKEGNLPHSRIFLIIPLVLIAVALFSINAIGAVPANIYINNVIVNPALTFPVSTSIPSCSNNWIGGNCIGSITYTANTVLASFVNNTGSITINSGVWVTTNSFGFVSGGAFNSLLGNILTGNAPNNGFTYSAGISFFNSIGGSGGGAGWDVFSETNGGQGGNSIAPGGLGGTSGQPNGNAGTTPSNPSFTNANIVSCYGTLGASIQNCVEGGQGGSGSSNNGIGGGAGYGIYIQAPSVVLGTVNTQGENGGRDNSGGDNNDGGGGGGAGGIIIAYSSLYVPGTYAQGGGSGGMFGSGGKGGNGGSGNIIAYQYTTQPIDTPLIYPSTYPINFYNQSGSGLGNILYSINSIYNGQVTVGPQNQNILSFVPPANQPSGFYSYNIVEVNTIASSTNTIMVNLTVNMTDIKSGVGNSAPCNGLIQYFANCATVPTFSITPNSWYIKSDNSQNTYGSGNFLYGTNNIDIWSNANLTFTPKIVLTYPFISFPANLINNPLITSITQTALTFVASITTPSNPTTRNAINIATIDQQFFTPTNTLTTTSFNWLINNYTGLNSINSNTNNTNTIWTQVNSYGANPNICLSNIQTTSSSSDGIHITAINNFLNSCVASLPQQYNIYLTNANSTQTQFIIYSSGGYGGYNDNLLVYTGTSISTIKEVQTWLIRPNGVPFTLYLQGGRDNQQYLFKVVSPANQILYTSALNTWGSTVTIYLNTSISVPTTSIINATATCSESFNVISNDQVVNCTGIDLHNFVNNWQVNIVNVTSVINTTVPGPVFWYNNTSSFFLSFPLVGKTTQYRFVIIAYAANQAEQLYANQFGSQTYNLIGSGGEDLIAIVAFLLAVAFGSRTKSLSTIFVLLMLWVLDILQITNFGYNVLIGLTAATLIWVYLWESRNKGN